MSAARLGAALFTLCTFIGNADPQIKIYEVPAPASHQNAGTPGATAAAPSPMTGRPAVTVQLDNTGITDWSFLNPRRPARVPVGPVDADIAFENLTADRTFEVTTTLAFKAGDIPTNGLPFTVPLLIYDVLTPGRMMTFDDLAQRWGLTANERRDLTIEQVETRLLTEAQSTLVAPNREDLLRVLKDVQLVEQVLRLRASKRAAETAARSNLAKLAPDATMSATLQAQEDLNKAIHERTVADRAVLYATGLVTEDNPDDDLPATRKALIDKLTGDAAALRKTRSTTAPGALAELNREIALLDVAVDALKNQSEETAFLAPQRVTMPGVVLEDCTMTAAAATCTAAIRVHPFGTGTFPHRVLELQPDGAAVARFNVRFFEEEETPARQVAYLISANNISRIAPPKTSATLMAVASVGVALDPFIEDRSATSRNCGFLCPDKPYTGARRTHYTGTGRVEITQTFGNLFDGKVNIAYKEGDLGAGAASTDVKLSQYRFNLYSEPGITFHYGKFAFAAPTSGIAINESGEGFRLAYRNVAISHITKRESATSAADAANRDSEVSIAEAINMPLPKVIRTRLPNLPIRTFSLIYAYGNDRKGEEKKKHPSTGIEETFFSAHSYTTYGGQVGFTIPRVAYGTLGAYRSRRDADEENAPCNRTLHVCDGRGDVALLTITRPFSVDEDGKAKRTVTLSLGRGSGDDPSTKTDDEGYIGETATFAPDLIFLSTLSGNLSTSPYFNIADYADKSEPFDPFNDLLLKRQFHALDLGAAGIGRGLANKTYTGLKYVDNSMSLLAFIARKLPFLQIPDSDIRSRATIITANHYSLRYPLFDSRDAGRELDVEFQVETPRSVKMSLKLGYYWPGAAVQSIIQKNVWTAAANISISL